jgi:DNA-binding HxlR family transcriptional regulator
MERKSFAEMECPAALALDVIGEWWTMLILRDVMLGMTRFEQFQERLGIARNILTRRLRALVAAGLLERIRYLDRPPRYEYRMSAKGRAFFPVLIALLDCGCRWQDGGVVRVIDRETGQPIDLALVDRNTGREITPASVQLCRSNDDRRSLRSFYAPDPRSPDPGFTDPGSTEAAGSPVEGPHSVIGPSRIEG